MVKVKTPQEIADDVDVWAGIGHLSMLTDDGQARRRAADLIRRQEERLTALANENRDARRLIALLVARLGGQVEISDAEIVATDSIPMVETWRSDATDGLIIRSTEIASR